MADNQNGVYLRGSPQQTRRRGHQRGSGETPQRSINHRRPVSRLSRAHGYHQGRTEEVVCRLAYLLLPHRPRPVRPSMMFSNASTTLSMPRPGTTAVTACLLSRDNTRIETNGKLRRGPRLRIEAGLIRAQAGPSHLLPGRIVMGMIDTRLSTKSCPSERHRPRGGTDRILRAWRPRKTKSTTGVRRARSKVHLLVRI